MTFENISLNYSYSFLWQWYLLQVSWEQEGKRRIEGEEKAVNEAEIELQNTKTMSNDKARNCSRLFYICVWNLLYIFYIRFISYLLLYFCTARNPAFKYISIIQERSFIEYVYKIFRKTDNFYLLMRGKKCCFFGKLCVVRTMQIL